MILKQTLQQTPKVLTSIASAQQTEQVQQALAPVQQHTFIPVQQTLTPVEQHTPPLGQCLGQCSGLGTLTVLRSNTQHLAAVPVRQQGILLQPTYAANHLAEKIRELVNNARKQL